jgi:chromosome condensin MukBEF complex kleisin-like MukF subunit
MEEVSKLANSESAGVAEWQKAIFSVKNLTEETSAARRSDWQGMILAGFHTGARVLRSTEAIQRIRDRVSASFLPRGW